MRYTVLYVFTYLRALDLFSNYALVFICVIHLLKIPIWKVIKEVQILSYRFYSAVRN